MLIKFLVDEDVTNYKKTSMVIGLPFCDGKCWRDLNVKEPGKYNWSLCHNGNLLEQENIEIDQEKLIMRYLNNPLSHAIVFAGMEPLLSIDDLIKFILSMRFTHNCDDDIIIYTGYNEDESRAFRFITEIHSYDIKNVIVKFGRYIPNQEIHYDDVLGVKLASDNQYAKKIS